MISGGLHSRTTLVYDLHEGSKRVGRKTQLKGSLHHKPTVKRRQLHVPSNVPWQHHANFFNCFSLHYLLTSTENKTVKYFSYQLIHNLTRLLCSCPFLWFCRKRKIHNFTLFYFFFFNIIVKISCISLIWNLTFELLFFPNMLFYFFTISGHFAQSVTSL